jgi:hypothetical protein
MPISGRSSKSGAVAPKTGAQSGAAISCTESHQKEKTVAILRDFESFPGNHNGLKVEDRDTEHLSNSLRKSHAQIESAHNPAQLAAKLPVELAELVALMTPEQVEKWMRLGRELLA